MTADEFSEFRHEAVPALMALNDACGRKYGMYESPRWDYDLDVGTPARSRPLID